MPCNSHFCSSNIYDDDDEKSIIAIIDILHRTIHPFLSGLLLKEFNIIFSSHGSVLKNTRQFATDVFSRKKRFPPSAYLVLLILLLLLDKNNRIIAQLAYLKLLQFGGKCMLMSTELRILWPKTKSAAVLLCFFSCLGVYIILICDDIIMAWLM